MKHDVRFDLTLQQIRVSTRHRTCCRWRRPYDIRITSCRVSTVIHRATLDAGAYEICIRTTSCHYRTFIERLSTRNRTDAPEERKKHVQRWEESARENSVRPNELAAAVAYRTFGSGILPAGLLNLSELIFVWARRTHRFLIVTVSRLFDAPDGRSSALLDMWRSDRRHRIRY